MFSVVGLAGLAGLGSLCQTILAPEIRVLASLSPRQSTASGQSQAEIWGLNLQNIIIIVNNVNFFSKTDLNPAGQASEVGTPA